MTVLAFKAAHPETHRQIAREIALEARHFAGIEYHLLISDLDPEDCFSQCFALVLALFSKFGPVTPQEFADTEVAVLKYGDEPTRSRILLVVFGMRIHRMTSDKRERQRLWHYLSGIRVPDTFFEESVQ